jgi:hypothetical protein
MTACTQPRCTGTISDGYCDVCGSPVGAAPFVPAESSATPGSPMPAGESDACTQPGCSGRIVDGYCDVCGSPVGAVPFVPAATSAVSSVPAAAAGLAAVLPPTSAHAAVDEEELPIEPDRAQDYRRRVAEAQLPDDVREAALSEVSKLERTGDHSTESDDVRAWLDTILELPWSTKATDWIDIHESREVEATLRRLIEPAGVANLEEDDTPEIEAVVADVEERDEVEAATDDTEEGETAELEAVADLEEEDSAEVEPAAELEEGDSAEVEAAGDLEEGDSAGVEAAGELEDGDTAEVEVVADLDEGDTAEAEAAVADPKEGDQAVADIEKAGTAPGSRHDDTVETPAVLPLISEGPPPPPQPPDQQVTGPAPVPIPEEKKRFRSRALAAIALAAVLIGALLFFFGVRRDGNVTAQSTPAVTAAATATVSNPTSEQSDASTGIEGGEPTIQLEDYPGSGRPFEIVRIEGTYRGGPNIFLQLQFWEGGEWLSFPLPSRTNQAGQFTAHAEFDQPGSYRLRVLDPHSGVTSKTFVLVIEG